MWTHTHAHKKKRSWQLGWEEQTTKRTECKRFTPALWWVQRKKWTWFLQGSCREGREPGMLSPEGDIKEPSGENLGRSSSAGWEPLKRVRILISLRSRRKCDKRESGRWERWLDHHVQHSAVFQDGSYLGNWHPTGVTQTFKFVSLAFPYSLPAVFTHTFTVCYPTGAEGCLLTALSSICFWFQMPYWVQDSDLWGHQTHCGARLSRAWCDVP